MQRVIRVRYENGVLKPLDKVDAEEGEVLVVRVVRRDLAEKLYGSLRAGREEVERALREAEDELGVY